MEACGGCLPYHTGAPFSFYDRYEVKETPCLKRGKGGGAKQKTVNMMLEQIMA